MQGREPSTKAVVVVSGTTSGLAVVRALGARGVPVVVADYSDHTYANVSRYVRRRVRLPDPDHDESAFVDALLDQAGHLPGALLVPGSDKALVALARNKVRLEGAFAVGCPGLEVVDRVINKRHTYEIAQTVGVPIPRTLYPTSLDEVEDFASSTDYPCLVKPTQGHLFYKRYGRKMFAAADPGQLLRMYKRAVEAEFEVVLQEFIPGKESDGAIYNSYRWDDQPPVEFTAMKVRNAPPRYGSPRVVVSRYIPELSEPAQRLLDALGLNGFSCSEFKRDARDGTFKLMEVNARHNMSGMLAIDCGIDFPWMQYRHLLFGEQPKQRDYATGVYWIDVLSDIKHTLSNMRSERMTPRSFLAPYFEPHVFAVASASDPKPLLKRIKIRWQRSRVQVSESS